MAASVPEKEVPVPAVVRPFLQSTELIAKLISAGTAACFAEAVTLPMDCAKIKLQVLCNYQLENASNIQKLVLIVWFFWSKFF